MTGPGGKSVLEAPLAGRPRVRTLLSTPEQILFRRLSVFAASFALEAAETVCSGDGVEQSEVLYLVARLVEKSLVLTEEDGGETRYRLLAPIREYAAARLEDAGEVAVVRTRHRDFVLLSAEEVFLDPELGGPDAEATSSRQFRWSWVS
jgi:predicted ATPase